MPGRIGEGWAPGGAPICGGGAPDGLHGGCLLFAGGCGKFPNSDCLYTLSRDFLQSFLKLSMKITIGCWGPDILRLAIWLASGDCICGGAAPRRGKF